MSNTVPANFQNLSDPFSGDLDMNAPSSSQIPQIDRQQTPRPRRNPPPEDVIHELQFHTHQDQNTLCIGVLAYLDMVDREIRQMRNFIHIGYKRLNDVSEDGNLVGKVESARLQARVWNKFHVTELEEPFRLLPRSNGEFPNEIPSTGAVLRIINHKEIDYLLDRYDLPFIPTMFLLEKKIIYLHFLGANRVVMHRILD